MQFKDWITKKYVDWRGDAIGNERSITKFAEYIGVSQPVMSGWMNGSIPDRQHTIAKVAAKYPDVYDVLNIDPSIRKLDDSLTQLAQAISEIPEDVRDEYQNIILDILSYIAEVLTEKEAPLRRLSDVPTEEIFRAAILVARAIRTPGSSGGVSLYEALFKEQEKDENLRKIWKEMEDELDSTQ